MKMAFMVNHDSDQFTLFEDFPQTPDQTDMTINFEEIAKLAESFTECNNSKLMEDNGVSVGLQLASPSVVMVQPPTQDPASAQLTPHIQPQLLELEYPSPEMCLLQPISPETLVESALLPHSIQPVKLDCLQPAMPVPSSVQPASPGQHYSVAAPQTSIPDFSLLYVSQPPSLRSALLSYSVHHQEEAMPVHSSDNVADAPKKRGRNPSRPRRTKMYEMGPLEDEKEEKKRKSAINAKQHRDKLKDRREYLAKELKAVTAQRDSLLKLVQQLTQTEAQLQLWLANQEC